MLGKTFDPQKFIDREDEKKLFEEMLQLKDAARILAIRDAGGMGKSQLLQKFQHYCRAVRPRIPVCLVELSQLPDPSPFGLISQLQRDLSSLTLTFPTFLRMDMARRRHDFTTISSGAVNLQGANLSGAQITAAGVINQIEHAELVTVQGGTVTLTAEQQETAQEICVKAFLADLMQHCQQRLVVLLFDGFERCAVDLQNWLLHHFLEPYCFDLTQRPRQLVLVIAGREIPPFEQHWSATECNTIIKSVRALGKWSTVHVEQFLQAHGYPDFTPQDVTAFHQFLSNGIPPLEVVQLIPYFVANRRSRS